MTATHNEEAAPAQPKGRCGTCEECGEGFAIAASAPRHGAKRPRFCSKACKDAPHNRAGKRGKIALPLMQAWRAGRGSTPEAKFAYGEVCRLLDMWNAEDRERGRAPAAKTVKRKIANQWTAADVAMERRA